MAPLTRQLRIGVDVGGTNTDGVLLDPTRADEADKGIIAWHKAPTTTNPSVGISDAITTMFREARIGPDELAAAQAIIRLKLEKVIDTMKTSPADVPVLLVGGGAVIAPDILRGASRVLKPRWASVANAIGAAIARVSAVVDTVQSTEGTSTTALLRQISEDAIARTVAAGADPDTVQIVEMETLPLQYIAHKSRFIVRAAGEFDYSRPLEEEDVDALGEEDDDPMDQYEKNARESAAPAAAAANDVDVDAYRPAVRNRVWRISETDLGWISSGCYILGTGGGGSPYPHMIRLRQMLRAGAVVRVVSPDDLPDDARVGTGGGMGSPTVGIEKLPGDEMQEAQHALFALTGAPATHMIAIEIGGGNGMQGLILGASTMLDLPVVDGDWMGRAYPTKWQTTPVVFNERSPVWLPIAMADGNGNVVTMPRATSDLQVERVLRAALSQMGSHVGCAEGPVSGAETRRWVVEHTLSQAWRIGRAVHGARRRRRLDTLADTIIDACGGPAAARLVWQGKIVGVTRTLRMGHVYGECVIEGADVAADTNANALSAHSSKLSFVGRVKIPFKNENIAVIRVPEADPAETTADEPVLDKQEDVLALVPDLISVIDAQNGEAIGTPEYRYGLLVLVLGIAASDRWTGSERGVAIGGPAGFGFHHLTFQPLGTYSKPKSVIDEFDVSD